MFTGSASVFAYQQALRTLTYINRAREPLPATRVVTIQVFDGVHSSNMTTANITLSLINDNMLTLTCGIGSVTFTEESSEPVPVTSELVLVDFDENHMIVGAAVSIGFPQEGDELHLDPNVAPHLNVTTHSDTRIEVSGKASDTYYQVYIPLQIHRRTMSHTLFRNFSR